VGGGTLRLQGNGILRNSQIEGMNFRIEADDVRVRYPEGLRTVLDGTLVLSGDWTAPRLAGSLQIQNLSYRSEFEQFLALFQPGGLGTANPALERVQLSIRVSGTRNITIRNELADVQASADLDIRGTASNPSMTGHVETTGGTLSLHNRRYEITRGLINFVDPLRIDPAIDIQAETEIREYRVILRVYGRGSNVTVEPSSDPPLPQLELIGLIAGGRTRDELENEQRQFGASTDLPTSEELFKLGAASILLDQVQAKSRFGLLGLDRIRIDPYLSTENNNTRARVTVTEQVTKDLSVTYSQDVASNEQRVILIEYFFSNNLSILASREETRDTPALGLDIRWRKRF
jgi:translocation and assembly module TamB